MSDHNEAFALPEIEFPDPMGLRLAALYLDVSEMRIGALVREGRIEATKDERGRWLVTQAALDNYQETKGSRGGGGPRGDGKFWKVRVKYDDLEKVKAALAKFGCELEPAYNYEKQKEYRKRAAAKKAAAEAEDEE